MQEVSVKYDLDISEFFSKMEKVSTTLGKVEDNLTGMRKQNPFVQATQSASQYNQTLGQQAGIYQKIQATAESFRQEQVRIKQVYADLKKSQNEYIAAGQYQEYLGKLEQVKQRLKEMSLALGEVADEQEKASKPASGKGGLFGGVGGSILEFQAFIGLELGVVEGLKKMVTESAAFGKGLSELSALTGVTGKDLEFLADAAIDLENKSGIAAKDIVEGFKLVGGIKPELLASKEALVSVTTEVIALSQASGISLQDAATSAVGALNQFGEGADQAGRFVNVLAAGAKVGASEVNDTAEALKVSGTAMAAAGLSFEQGNAIIQSLAGVMIKGSEAGTGLRNTILKLETSADKNLRPSVVGLDKALENAAKKLDTTTELAKVFGQENIVAARRILDTRTEITQLTKDLTGTNVAYEQQKINLDNLATDLNKAGTAVTGFFRDLGQSQDGFFRKVVQGFTAFVLSISSKTGPLKAAFSEIFSSQSALNPETAISRGIAAYRNQSSANDLVTSKTAQNAGLKSATLQSVADDTKALADLYAEQGETVPKAQAKAIQKVKEQRDAEYDDLVANHQRLRKELEKEISDTGSDSGKLNAAFAENNKKITAARIAKQKADSEAARQDAQNAKQAATLKSLLNEPMSDEEKKLAAKQLKDSQDNYKLLLQAGEDYTKEYQKLETQFGKDKLEALKKDDVAYLAEKAKLDKQEVDVEQAHLLKLQQLASSNQTKINKATGQREVIANQSVQLPTDVKAQFDARRTEIDNEADRQIRISKIRQQAELIGLEKQTNQTELDLFDKYWEERLLKEGKNSQLFLALSKKYDSDRAALVQDQLIRDQKAQEQISLSNIERRIKGPTETGTAFAKRNELDAVAVQINSAENQIYGLQGQNDPKNTPEIVRLEAYVKALKDKRKEIELLGPANRDIYDLLGISKSFKDDTERQAFLQGVDLISNAIHEATQAAVADSEAKISALDQQISAKQEQIKTEEDRNKEGYANNLALRQKELADLQAQKAREEQVRRKALAVQQTLDIASTISNNAVTVSNTIAAISEMFKQYGKIPFVGVILALGAVATILSTISSVKSKVTAITKLREGGRVSLWGRSHEQGGHRIAGTDIEVERGEHVINARSSDKYDKTLEAINKNNPHHAFRMLMLESGLGLPQSVITDLKRGDMVRVQPVMDTKALEQKLDAVVGRLEKIEKHTKPGKQYMGTPDDYIEIDGDHKRRMKK